MYFYVMKHFDGLGWRHLKIDEDGTVSWRTEAPRAYYLEQAEDLARQYKCEIVEA